MIIKYNGDTKEIIKAIKHIMIDKEIKQKDIVIKTGWNKVTVSNLLNGRTKQIGLNVILQLCDAIGCDLYIKIEDREKTK